MKRKEKDDRLSNVCEPPLYKVTYFYYYSSCENVYAHVKKRRRFISEDLLTKEGDRRNILIPLIHMPEQYNNARNKSVHVLLCEQYIRF